MLLHATSTLFMNNPFLDKLDSSQVSTAAARPQSKLALFGGCDVRSHAN